MKRFTVKFWDETGEDSFDAKWANHWGGLQYTAGTLTRSSQGQCSVQPSHALRLENKVAIWFQTNCKFVWSGNHRVWGERSTSSTNNMKLQWRGVRPLVRPHRTSQPVGIPVINGWVPPSEVWLGMARTLLLTRGNFLVKMECDTADQESFLGHVWGTTLLTLTCYWIRRGWIKNQGEDL